MLAIEQPHRAIEFVFRLRRGGVVLPARRALDVLYDDLWIIIHLPAAFLDTIRPIEVFAVHPEGFVQQANLLDRRAAYEHERSDDRIDFRRLIGIEVGHVVAAKARAM